MDDIVFSDGNGELKNASEVRANVPLPDGQSMTVICTHEGIIIDCFDSAGEVCATSSIMYAEKYEQMTAE